MDRGSSPARIPGPRPSQTNREWVTCGHKTLVRTTVRPAYVLSSAIHAATRVNVHDPEARNDGAGPAARLSARPGGQPGRPGHQVVTLAQVGGAGGGGLELGDRAAGVAGLFEQVGSHRTQPVVVAETAGEAVEQGQARVRAVRHGGC